jgi:hypothetical protein
MYCTARPVDPPDYCPECGQVTFDVNLSVNQSQRALNDDGVIAFTGDTDYAVGLGIMPSIGTYCASCSLEWIDGQRILDALDSLDLGVHHG